MLKKVKYNNLPIGWKYTLVFMLIIILFGGSAGTVSYLIKNIGNGIHVVNTKSDEAIGITEMGSLVGAKSIYLLNYYYTGEEENVENFKAENQKFNDIKNEVETLLTTKEQRELLHEIVTSDLEINRILNFYIVPAIKNGNQTSAATYLKNADQLRLEAISKIDALKEIVNKERAQAIQHANNRQFYTFVIQIAFAVASLILGGILLFFISRNISKGLQHVVKMNDEIAKGNLSVIKIADERNDEIGFLARAANQMRDTLKTMFEQVERVSVSVSKRSEMLNGTAREVKTGTEQIAITMEELASGTEVQATQAGEISSSMQSFTNMAQESNENGKVIHMASHEILNMTEEGMTLITQSTEQMKKVFQIVQDAVQKVKGLDDQSKQISQLVNIIQDIADQTNLLALNAAIEAARAGEHGRGFAVVANEVKNLAEQVSQSVTSITDIVNNIQTESNAVATSLQAGYKEVTLGTEQIKTTNDTFNGISMFVNEMTTYIETVTKNLEEMAAKSSEMNSSIQDIAAISEETSAGVEQTTASIQQTNGAMEEFSNSANELAKMATELNGLLDQFKM